MKRYSVTIIRHDVRSTIIELDAKNKSAAERLALRMAKDIATPNFQTLVEEEDVAAEAVLI